MTTLITREEFKVWLSDNTDYVEDATGGSIDNVLDDCIRAAVAEIEEDCAREFELTTDEAREFVIDVEGRVPIADLLSTSHSEQSTTLVVKVDTSGDDSFDVTLTSSDYRLMPRTDSRGRKALHYQMIVPTVTGSSNFMPGYLCEVTGDWGHIEDDGRVPDAIKGACYIKAASIFARRDAKLGSRLAGFGGSVVEMVKQWDAHYESLIAPYRRHGWGLS